MRTLPLKSVSNWFFVFLISTDANGMGSFDCFSETTTVIGLMDWENNEFIPGRNSKKVKMPLIRRTKQI